MSRFVARRAVALPTALTLAMLSGAGAILASAGPSDAAARTVRGSTTVGSATWFHDPVSKAGRRAELAVPSRPSSYGGPLRHTKADYRSRNGSLAVPVAWAAGHQLAVGQAVVLNGAGLFGFDSVQPTKAAKVQVKHLDPSLAEVTGIRCEGYTDYNGRSAHERALGRQRAAAVCALVRSHRPALTATVVSYGSARPVVVGGSVSERAANRRVVIVVTGAKPAVPNAPRLTAAIGGDASASLAFTRPTDGVAAHPSGYQVSLGGGPWKALTTSGTTKLTARLTGLTNGTTYSVRVRALNATVGGPASNSRTVTPSTIPGAPALTAALPGDSTATLTFTAPVVDGGAAITRYQATPDGGSTWQTLTTTGSGPLTATVAGLTNGTPGAVAVRAVNVAGPGPASNSIQVDAGTPGPPNLISLVPDYTTVAPAAALNLTFTDAAPNGSPVTGYQFSQDGQHWYNLSWTPGTPNTGVLYVAWACNAFDDAVAVRGVNSVGPGGSSNVRTITLESCA